MLVVAATLLSLHVFFSNATIDDPRRHYSSPPPFIVPPKITPSPPLLPPADILAPPPPPRKLSALDRQRLLEARQRLQRTRPAGNTTAMRERRMDLEDGVRFGSLCLNAAGGSRCPVASDVLETLDAAAAATEAPAASPLCLFTSLTEAYVEGHVVFAKAALRHAPALRQRSIPMHILDQSLSESGRARVLRRTRQQSGSTGKRRRQRMWAASQSLH